MVSMRPAAFHGEQWTVLLVWFWNVLDCGFPVLSTFHESPELLSAENCPQAGFPAAPYKDYPTQTVSLREISLPAWHGRDGPAPVALVSVCSAAGAVQDEYAGHWCGDAPCVGTEQLHGQLFRPVRSLCVPRCPSGQAASRCRPTLLQISAPSGAARWMQFDVSAACSSDGLFVLEYLEWKSLP